MQLDTIPNFNIIKPTLDVCEYQGKLIRNELINLNYIVRVTKYSEEFTGEQYREPAIWFYYNVLNSSHSIMWWRYSNTEEGFKMRDADFDKICNLSKI